MLSKLGGQIQSLRAGFKPGFVSYKAENAFTKGNGTPGECAAYLSERKPGWISSPLNFLVILTRSSVYHYIYTY